MIIKAIAYTLLLCIISVQCHLGDGNIDSLIEDLGRMGVGSSGRVRSRSRTADKNGTRHLSCLDESGLPVDWWFAYKLPKSESYLFLSSADVAAGQNRFHPASESKSIRSPYTSPLLKTIYQAEETKETVWLAWNDQSLDGKDAYEASISPSTHAHAKGFAAVRPHSDNAASASISSFLIQHSLPKFPAMKPSGQRNWNGVSRSKLPLYYDIFASNLAENGQHFLCISPEIEHGVKLNTFGELDRRGSNMWAKVTARGIEPFLLEYLRKIHPAIIGTNYDDQSPSHYIWRQYFSTLSHPSSALYSYRQSLSYGVLSPPVVAAYYDQGLISRSTTTASSLPRSAMFADRAVLPLSATPFRLNFTSGMIELSSSYEAPLSSGQHRYHGCVNGTEDACIGSGTIDTTKYDSPTPVTWSFFAKHAACHLDLYDDYAALLLVDAQDVFEFTYDRQIKNRYGLLVQHWMDSATLPKKHSKRIYATSNAITAQSARTKAFVDIDNCGGLNAVPFVGGRVAVTKSRHSDHSKWAIGFALETLNGFQRIRPCPAEDDDQETSRATPDPSSPADRRFKPLFCAGDLNRTWKQAKGSAKECGRSGGLLCSLEVPQLWEAMMSLDPFAAKLHFANEKADKAIAIQKRLRQNTAHTIQWRPNFPALTLPAQAYQQQLYRILDLPFDRNLSHTNPIPFDAYLQEMHRFIFSLHLRDEHVALAAFELFHAELKNGGGMSIDGAAQRALNAATEQCENGRLSHLQTRVVFTTPELTLVRGEPDYENCFELTDPDDDDRVLAEADGSVILVPAEPIRKLDVLPSLHTVVKHSQLHTDECMKLTRIALEMGAER